MKLSLFNSQSLPVLQCEPHQPERAPTETELQALTAHYEAVQLKSIPIKYGSVAAIMLGFIAWVFYAFNLHDFAQNHSLLVSMIVAIAPMAFYFILIVYFIERYNQRVKSADPRKLQPITENEFLDLAQLAQASPTTQHYCQVLAQQRHRRIRQFEYQALLIQFENEQYQLKLEKAQQQLHGLSIHS